jgi:glycogen operon protein
MLSRGVPMLLAGDEVLHTQRGNNNAYSQDNALSWFDWGAVNERRAMLRFTRELIALRRRHPSLTANRFFTGAAVPDRGLPDVSWHGARLGEPGWNDAGGQLLAFTLAGTGEEEDLHAILNMSGLAIDVMLPSLRGRSWFVALDTARASPGDIVAPERQRRHTAAVYRVTARSVVVLEARVSR